MRVFNAFVPDRIRTDPETARRARLVVGLSFGFGALIVVGLPLRLSIAQPPAWLAIQMINLGIFLAAPFLVRATGRPNLAGMLVLIAAVTGVIVVSYYEGGLRSPIVFMVPFLPLVAMLTLGRGLGWLLTAVIVILSSGSLALHRMELLHPRALLGEEQEIALLSVGVALATLMVGYAVWLWEREREKAEQELRAAQRAAQRAAHAKNEFLVNMSQEIQAPMAGIVGLTDLLLELDLPPQAWEHTRTIASATEQLGRILDEISKIEAGEIVLEIEEFSLQETLHEVIDLLRPAAAAKGIEIGSSIDESLGDHRRGDLARLRQVLLNLVGNAIKFTDEGRVDLRAEPGDDETGVRFTIRDTGGASAEASDPFFSAPRQPEEPATRPSANSGLGLAISRQLAELMGGSIQVDSSPRQGSTFTFTASLVTAPGSRSGDE